MKDFDWYTDAYTYKAGRVREHDYGFMPEPAKKIVGYKPPSGREL